MLKLGVLYSGGKDSNYALYDVVQIGHRVECLLSVRPYGVESMLFHYPNAALTDLQSECLEIPLLSANIGPEIDESVALIDLVRKAKLQYKIEGVVTGGLKSEYQRRVFSKVFEECGVKTINPLWKLDEEIYLRRLITERFKIIVTRVAAYGLGADWLGVELDKDKVEELICLAKKHRFNPSFEGGEGETFVLDMPLFKKEIVISEKENMWEKDGGTLNIKKAILKNKPTNV